jgi:hypothetical protein
MKVVKHLENNVRDRDAVIAQKEVELRKWREKLVPLLKDLREAIHDQPVMAFGMETRTETVEGEDGLPEPYPAPYPIRYVLEDRISEAIRNLTLDETPVNQPEE